MKYKLSVYDFKEFLFDEIIYIVTDEAFCLEKGVKFKKCVSVLQNMVLKSWSNRWMN